jgi:hypothetical protein
MRKLLSLIVATLILAGCSTSKFDYQTAYKFSKYDYQSKHQSVPELITPQAEDSSLEAPGLNQHEPIQRYDQPIALVASTKPYTEAVKAIPPDFSLVDHKNIQQANYSNHYANASKQEKKLIRNKVKRDFKTLRQQMRMAKKDAANQDIVFNRKMWIGAIILGAGILIAILAHGGIGAVAIIVGIGLLAWGLIEQV